MHHFFWKMLLAVARSNMRVSSCTTERGTSLTTSTDKKTPPKSGTGTNSHVVWELTFISRYVFPYLGLIVPTLLKIIENPCGHMGGTATNSLKFLFLSNITWICSSCPYSILTLCFIWFMCLFLLVLWFPFLNVLLHYCSCCNFCDVSSYCIIVVLFCVLCSV